MQPRPSRPVGSPNRHKPPSQSPPPVKRLSRSSLNSASLAQKEEGCNCVKSHCLKLYCKCFGSGNLCGKGCLCTNCKNMRDNMERSQAINKILEKDPLGFYGETSKKGCNCKKSNCLKKYCDCFRQGKPCSQLCYCFDCSNGEGSARMKIRKE